MGVQLSPVPQVDVLVVRQALGEERGHFFRRCFLLTGDPLPQFVEIGLHLLWSPYFIFQHMPLPSCPSANKTTPPVPHGQRAKTRGTTSGSPAPPGTRPHEVPGRTSALYRARPAEPTHGFRRFGPLLRDVFTPPSSPPSTARGFSWQDDAALLVPVIASTGGSIAGKSIFVK